MKINRLTAHKHELVFEGGSMIIDYRELSAIGIMGTATNFIILNGVHIKDDRFDECLSRSYKVYNKREEEKVEQMLEDLKKIPVNWVEKEKKVFQDLLIKGEAFIEPSEFEVLDPVYPQRHKDVNDSNKRTWSSSCKESNETVLDNLNYLFISLKKWREELSFKSISDGYHTFEELYDFRMMYNAALFNEWGNFPVSRDETGEPHEVEGLYYQEGVKYDVHKSWMYQERIGGAITNTPGWFVVMAELPTGQISNKYAKKYWDMFHVPERIHCNEFDGHTAQDVLIRLRNLIQPEI